MSGVLAILGPGTLGLSTAQWAVACGFSVRLLGRDLSHAEAGVRAIHDRWEREAAAGRLHPEAHTRGLDLLQAGTLGTASLAGATALLEALPEEEALKAEALGSAARSGHPDLLLLSGTSALPIARLAAASGTEGRLVGFHLFVPVPRMGVVEMAVAEGTDPHWVSQARALGEALHKRVVQVRDQPGFAAARMALALGLEAMRLLEDGVASADDLDALMTLGYGHPAGPLEVSDRVGLDLRLRIAQQLHHSGAARFEPPRILEDSVRRGRLGRKTRRGFHAWSALGKRQPQG